MGMPTWTVQGYDPKAAFKVTEPLNHLHEDVMVDRNVHLEAHRMIFEKLPDQKVKVRLGNEEVIIKSHDLHRAWSETN